MLSDPKQVANEFNKFFASVGEGTSRCRDGSYSEPRGRPVVNPTQNTMYLRPVGPAELYNIIKTLKPRYSYGIDELPPILIKRCAAELTLPYYLLVNQSLSEGVFPDQLKTSIIKPIHKKDTKTDPCHYRPIALLPTSAKIFEKAMCNQLYCFCEKYFILDDRQNAFRKNRSTTLAVYTFIQKVLDTLDRKEYAIGIMLDMTKAYDKVLYKILLNKLYGIGVRGVAHKWLTSYLLRREQCVEIEFSDNNSGDIRHVRSNILSVKNSIPQGSVLGCILFLIYINDLPKVINETSVLFADDMSVIIQCNESEQLYRSLNNVLTNIISWMNDHNLEINFDKTKIIQFRPVQKLPLQINFSFNNTNLECVNDFTLLGLNIDTNVNWKGHIQKIKSKLSSFVYALKELKKTTDTKTTQATYYAYAHAWLTYGIVLWGNCTDIDELFKMQKKCLRIICHMGKRESCREEFTKNNLMTVTCIYIYEMCKFVRKNIHLYIKLGDQNRRFTSRYENKLQVPESTLELHKNSPYAKSIQIYNKLPYDLISQDNDIHFLTTLKSLLLQKAYYSLKEFLEDK